MKTRTKSIIICSVFGLLMSAICYSYALFFAEISGTEYSQPFSVDNGDLEVVFEDGPEVSITGNNIKPGEFTATKTFKVTNNGSREASYSIIWENLVNTFVDKGQLVNTIACHTYQNYGTASQIELTGNDSTCKSLVETPIPGSGTDIDIIPRIIFTPISKTSTSVAPSETHIYTYTITFKNKGFVDNINQGKILEGTIAIADYHHETPKITYIVSGGSVSTVSDTISSSLIENYEAGNNISISKAIVPNENTRLYSAECYNPYGKVVYEASWNEMTKNITLTSSVNNTASLYKPDVRNNELSSSFENNFVYADDINATCYIDFVGNTFKDSIIKDNENTITSDQNIDYSTSNGTGLYHTNGEFDRTTYFFRGNVTNNYVSFADKTWRIVRINEDGSVKLVLADYSGTSLYNSSHESKEFVGYQYSLIDNEQTVGHSSTIKSTLEAWYNTNIGNTYDAYIGDNFFCNDRSILSETTSLITYNTYDRYNNSTPSYKCYNHFDRLTVDDLHGDTVLEKKIGLLTVDELIYAGEYKSANPYTSSTYLKTTSPFWTMSPYQSDLENSDSSMFIYDGHITSASLDTTNISVLPVISIRKDIPIISGNGTVETPYLITEQASN